MEDLKSRIKHIAVGALVALILVGGGFAAGRYAAPDRVVVTEKVRVVEVEKQVVVTQVKTEIERVYIKDEKKATHTEETDVKHPDGTVEHKKTTDENAETVVHQQEVKFVDRWNERIVEKKVEVFKDREKLIERSRPAWEIGAMGGVDLPSVFGARESKGFSILPNIGSTNIVPVFGLDLQRRVVGPIKAGIWGLSSGAAGIKVSIEF